MPGVSNVPCQALRLQPSQALRPSLPQRLRGRRLEGLNGRRSTLQLLLGLCCAPAAARAALKGRTACVTGASRGIGKGIAIALGEAGAKVFVTGRRKEAVKTTADLVTEAGGQGVPLVCDHGVDEQVKQVFAEIGSQCDGKLDILVNNAFQDPAQKDAKNDQLLSKGAKFFELPVEIWDDFHRVGLRSHYVSSYYAAPLLLSSAKTSDWRPLLCVTSAPAAVTYYYATAYGVAKAASDRLARDLQVELGPEGIDCVSLWPGVVYTEFVQSLYEKGDTDRINRVTGGRDPNVVCESPLLTGRVVARLADDASARKTAVSNEGLTSRVCVVAEAARDLKLRDGGKEGSVAQRLYGPDREPAASIRSLGYLLPSFLEDKLPPPLQWLVAPGGPLASKDLRVPFSLMAQDPRTEDPRKQSVEDFTKVITNTVSVG